MGMVIVSWVCSYPWHWSVLRRETMNAAKILCGNASLLCTDCQYSLNFFQPLDMQIVSLWNFHGVFISQGFHLGHLFRVTNNWNLIAGDPIKFNTYNWGCSISEFPLGCIISNPAVLTALLGLDKPYIRLAAWKVHLVLSRKNSRLLYQTTPLLSEYTDGHLLEDRRCKVLMNLKFHCQVFSALCTLWNERQYEILHVVRRLHHEVHHPRYTFGSFGHMEELRNSNSSARFLSLSLSFLLFFTFILIFFPVIIL